MKILVLTNLYPPHNIGGYELRCRDVTESLCHRGHDVSVLTSNHVVDEGIKDEVRDYQVDRRLQVHGFFGHPWRGIRDLVQLETTNNALLRESIAKFRPDIIHVWNLGGISKSLILTLQSQEIPYVFDVSDHWIASSLKADVWLDWWNRTKTSLPARLQRTWWNFEGQRRRFDQEAPTNPLSHIEFQRVYFCSSKMRRITADAGYPVAHGEVIHCPVDSNRFNGAPSSPESPVKKLLYAGRLDPDKGIFSALKAMCLIRESKGTTLTVFGDGEPDYVSGLREFVKRNQIPVTFDSASYDEMPAIYRDHDALIFPSEWEEPFALAPLEAMASGIPVIGTMTGGSAELLRHGQNALTFEAGNSPELASRIRTLVGDPALAASIAGKAQREVRQRFPLPVITDQIERYLIETPGRWVPTPLPNFHAA